MRAGYRGPIISTVATKALAGPLLQDAMQLARASALKRGSEPLYEEADIAQALSQWQGIGYHQTHELADGITLEFFDAGHILGSAMARFSREGRSVVFTGDLGGGNSPLLGPAEHPEANYLLMESVYGNRTRDDSNRIEELTKGIAAVAASGGTLLIPAFSTERTQDILFDIRALYKEGKVPTIPVYLDSPLAEKITAAYLAHPEYFSSGIQQRLAGGEHIFSFPQLQFIEDGSASQVLLGSHHGARVIIAGSGMSNGGRVVAHEEHTLPDERSTLLIVGYQAAGSLGRQLAEGAKEVTIHNQKVPVRCHIATLYGYSAHMDSEQLIDFASHFEKVEQVFVAMGEPAASGFLVQRLRDFLGLKAIAPESGDKATIRV